MTAAVGRAPFDPDAAEENSAHKGELIGAYLYRAGLTLGDVAWLPYSDRRGPSRTRLARAAYRAAGDPCPKRGDHSPPHNLTSQSWVEAREVLTELEALEGLGVAPYPRDLLDQAARWRRPAGMASPEPAPTCGDPPGGAGTMASPDEAPDGIPAAIPAPARPPRPVDLLPYPAGKTPALITSGSLPPLTGGIHAGPPRGWAALAALGPLTPARPCRWCGGPAVVGTLNGWRCAAHPPVRCDPRGDWGWALDWTPKPAAGCLAVCWCGRCGHYDPTAEIVAGYRAGAVPLSTVLVRVDADAPTA